MIALRHIVVVSCLVGGGSLAIPASVALADTTTEVFEYTGQPQNFVVPEGVTAIDVVACGAQGGNLDDVSVLQPAIGGLGGRVTSTIQVTPGESLAVFVGGDGDSGGWNGGGAGGDPFSDQANGGGASDVRRGGTGLGERVVIGGGGGGAGVDVVFNPPVLTFTGLAGGAGGGLEGGGTRPGTQTGPGIDPLDPAVNGALGVGGAGDIESGSLRAGGGGGSLFGGAGGAIVRPDPTTFLVMGAGSGGSGLGDVHEPGVCEGDGLVEITFDGVRPVEILPSGGGILEGDAGSKVARVPVRLSRPSDVAITVEWSTVDTSGMSGLAEAGSDYAAASGTVEFAPGQTEAFVPVEILGDAVAETPLLWGEWGLIAFSNPTNAVIDTGPFFGLGLFVILDELGDSPAS